MTRTAFENRYTAELSSGGMFAVWCLRKRVYCLKRGEPAEDYLGYAFEIAGIPSALCEFERVFDWLTRTATRPIQLGCPRCGRVSRDEGLLLAALAAFQRGDPGSGQILVQCLIPRVPSLHGAPAAANFAEALLQADLRIELAIAVGKAPAARGCGPPSTEDDTAVPATATVH